MPRKSAAKAAPPADDTLRIEGASPTPKANPLAGAFAQGPAAYAEEDTAKAAQHNEDSIAALRALAQEMVALERDAAEKLTAATNAAKALAEIQEVRLPKLMKQFEMDRFDFIDKTTGLKRIIKFESKWRVQLPTKKVGNQFVPDHEARKPIFQWFRDIGKGGIIKKEVVVPVGLQSDEFAAALMQVIKQHDATLDPGLSEKIEPSTLTAQISRLKDNGEDVHKDIKVEAVERAKVIDA